MTNQAELRDALRQMVSVLQEERQALAGLDLDGIFVAAKSKGTLCAALEQAGNDNLDDECLGLLDAARRLNAVNRQVRNLVAANVAARLDALMGTPALYRAAPAQARIGIR